MTGDQELFELECTRSNFNQLIYETIRLKKELSYVTQKKEELRRYEEENFELRKKLVAAIAEANRCREELIKMGLSNPVMYVSRG